MNLNKKNTRKILGIITFAILLFAAVMHLEAVRDGLLAILGIFMPFLLGGTLAFIFNVILRMFEEKIFGRLTRKNGAIWRKIKRVVCITLTILLVLGIIVMLLVLIIPELKRSIIMLAEQLPSYMNSLNRELISLTDQLGINNEALKNLEIDWKMVGEKIEEFFLDSDSDLLNTTLGITSGILSGAYNIVIGLVFAIYVLASKERLGGQIKRAFYAMFKRRRADKFFSVMSLSSDVFSKFVTGQFTESIILGVLCYIGMLVLSMPYALSISVLVAATSLIPVFGAFIGNLVGALLILMVDPTKALWFVIYLVILQQIESNIIYPRVVGKSVGLPGIWVFAAVTLGGSISGVFGMIFAVPLSSVCYVLFRDFVDKRNHEKAREVEMIDVVKGSTEKKDTEQDEKE